MMVIVEIVLMLENNATLERNISMAVDLEPGSSATLSGIFKLVTFSLT